MVKIFGAFVWCILYLDKNGESGSMGLHIAFEITKWPAISQDEGHNLIKCFPLTFDSLCNFKPISTDEYNVGKKIKLQSIKCLQCTMMLVVPVKKKPDLLRIISLRKILTM